MSLSKQRAVDNVPLLCDTEPIRLSRGCPVRSTARRPEYNLGPYGTLEDGEIRVAHVLPGHPGSAIQVRLQTVGLDGNDHLTYEAVSYVQGSEEDRPIIFMVEGDRSWPIRVTRSCEEILERFRCEYQARTLWIDAICINQGHLEDKSQQVSMMTTIYKQATRVCAGLVLGLAIVISPWP